MSKVRKLELVNNPDWIIDTYESMTGSYVRISKFEDYHWAGEFKFTLKEFNDMVLKINEFHSKEITKDE